MAADEEREQPQPESEFGLRRAVPGDEEVLDRYLREYSAEIAGFSGGAEDPQRGLEPQWLSDERLHPYLFTFEGEPFGMAMVMGREYAQALGEDVDWFLYDFYVADEVRSTGMAHTAAEMLFDHLLGTWAIAVLKRNRRARAFWRRVMEEYGVDVLPEPGVEGLPTYRFRSGVL